MPATKTLKSSEKTAILKKLVTELKKRYGGKTPKHTHTVLETLLYAACLEDTDYESADIAFEKLQTEYFDLNEIRVSSVTEIEHIFGELHDAAWKAMRIRETLQHTFEKHFAFDLEQLKRKTQDAAYKELKEIPFQTPFMRQYTLAHALGSHVLPFDTRMLQVLAWLGLGDPKAKPEVVADDLKSAVKKSDGPLMCVLLKAVSVDTELRWAFEEGPEEEDLDPEQAGQRLADLFKNPKPKKKAPKKLVKKKEPEKVITTKPITKKTDKQDASNTPKKKVITKVITVTKKKPAKTATKKKTVQQPVDKKVSKTKTVKKTAKKK